MRVKKAVIPIAGMGTRFLPITKSIPKEMLPIVDKPTIHYIVEEAVNSGIKEILFITNSYKKVVEDYFDQNFELEERLKKDKKTDKLQLLDCLPKCKIYYIRQGEPLGSGNAIKLAKAFTKNEPFAILYGDDLMKSDFPVLKQLIDMYEEYDSNIIGVQEVKDVSQYGIIEYENKETGKIKSIIEKPSLKDAPSNVAGLGRYIVKPEIYDELENLSRGAGGEYQFTDAMKNLMKKSPFYACKFSGTYFDTGSKIGYLKANISYALENQKLNNELINYLKEVIK